MSLIKRDNTPRVKCGGHWHKIHIGQRGRFYLPHHPAALPLKPDIDLCSLPRCLQVVATLTGLAPNLQLPSSLKPILKTIIKKQDQRHDAHHVTDRLNSTIREKHEARSTDARRLIERIFREKTRWTTPPAKRKRDVTIHVNNYSAGLLYGVESNFPQVTAEPNHFAARPWITISHGKPITWLTDIHAKGLAIINGHFILKIINSAAGGKLKVLAARQNKNLSFHLALAEVIITSPPHRPKFRWLKEPWKPSEEDRLGPFRFDSPVDEDFIEQIALTINKDLICEATDSDLKTAFEQLRFDLHYWRKTPGDSFTRMILAATYKQFGAEVVEQCSDYWGAEGMHLLRDVWYWMDCPNDKVAKAIIGHSLRYVRMMAIPNKADWDSLPEAARSRFLNIYLPELRHDRATETRVNANITFYNLLPSENDLSN
jgi:hypothetical protein